MAEAIAQEAFHNVAYFGGTFETLIQQVAGKVVSHLVSRTSLRREGQVCAARAYKSVMHSAGMSP